MRKLTIGSQNFTEVVVYDETGQGGARHEYAVTAIEKIESEEEPARVFARVSFQNGPVKEFGVNGCHQEDLLAIVIDRLQHFQSGEWACRENALALTKLEEAMHWLNHRTSERVKRGVEGTNAL